MAAGSAPFNTLVPSLSSGMGGIAIIWARLNKRPLSLIGTRKQPFRFPPVDDGRRTPAERP